MDIWRRRQETAYGLIPYVMLAASGSLSVVVSRPAGRPLVAVAVLGGSAAVLLFWFVTLHPDWMGRADRRGRMVVFLVALLLIAAGLVLLDPLFGIFAWVGYLYSFAVLPGRWRLAGVTATALITATAQAGGPPVDRDSGLLWGILAVANIGLAGAVSWFSLVTERQNAHRKQIIDELADANRRLELTMRENDGLHAQLLVQAREAGVLDERQRLAREIHDTIAQGLAGIVTQLEAAERARDRRADWKRHADLALMLARESLTEARRSVRAIGPEPLEGSRLPEALAELVRRWSGVHEVAARLVTTGEAQPLHPEVEVTLLRVAQEALTNVAKHAAASRVGVTLSYMIDRVTLDVRDDGVGLPPDLGPERGTPGSESFGLTGMRQRIDRVDGGLTIESEPGVGTAISVTVPASADLDRASA
ncbi:sensor histidine kinase [Micromonospora auratinigra]|uniref:sensor histidine kinase n=1 Tax=Micromonospora auratinigra TaxID=261654 RepID=UPI001E637EE0|nr:sensor histidine kinase [Micromonospora auratinigra]